LLWLYALASTAKLDENEGDYIYQPDCSTKELEGVLAEFSEMSVSLHSLVSSVGQIWIDVNHFEIGQNETVQKDFGMLIHVLGALGLQFNQISEAMEDALQARLKKGR